MTTARATNQERRAGRSFRLSFRLYLEASRLVRLAFSFLQRLFDPPASGNELVDAVSE